MAIECDVPMRGSLKVTPRVRERTASPCLSCLGVLAGQHQDAC